MRAIDVAEPLVTVPAAATVGAVARLLAEGGGRAVVVTDDDGLPAGIVTARDLVVRALARGLSCDAPIECVMTSEVVTADASESGRTIHRLLAERGVQQVPLVERGRLVGMVHRAAVADEAATEVLAKLRGCPRCLGEWLRPVATADATNFLCLQCRSCWRVAGGRFTPVEPRSCRGCAEHNFCRFPLLDYGVDPGRLPASPPACR